MRRKSENDSGVASLRAESGPGPSSLLWGLAPEWRVMRPGPLSARLWSSGPLSACPGSGTAHIRCSINIHGIGVTCFFLLFPLSLLLPLSPLPWAARAGPLSRTEQPSTLSSLGSIRPKSDGGVSCATALQNHSPLRASHPTSLLPPEQLARMRVSELSTLEGGTST